MGVDKMNKMVQAYIYKEDGVNRIVVTDKRLLKNAKEEYWEEIRLAIPDRHIEEWHMELEMMKGE